MRQVTQSVAADLTVVLTLASTGAAATGIAAAALTVQFSKNGGAFAVKAVAGGDWTELGSGVYTLAFTAAELDTVGPLVFTVNSATTAQFVGEVDVVAASVATTAAEVLTCVLSGYVYDLQGMPVAGSPVWARVLGVSYQGTVGVTADSASTMTNANGQFFLTLARLVEVQIDVPRMNYSRRLTVPNAATADLFEVP
jgi:hypothetical protein